MKRTLTTLTVAATMFASSAYAFDPDPDDLQKLLTSLECERCDLWRADLRGADLTKAYLNEANLTGANLTGANLSYVDMQGAILCNTTMPDSSVIYSGC